MHNIDVQRRFHAYWNSLRGSKIFPTEAEIDPDQITDIWPFCFLISIDDVALRLDYRYSYLGSEVTKILDRDAIDSSLALRLLSSGNPILVNQIKRVLTERKFIICEPVTGDNGKLPIKCFVSMAPLGYGD